MKPESWSRLELRTCEGCGLAFPSIRYFYEYGSGWSHCNVRCAKCRGEHRFNQHVEARLRLMCLSGERVSVDRTGTKGAGL